MSLIDSIKSRIRYKLIAIGIVLMAMIVVPGSISISYLLSIRQGVATTKLTGPLHISVLEASDASQHLIEVLQGLVSVCHLNMTTEINTNQALFPVINEPNKAYTVLDELYEQALKNHFDQLSEQIHSAKETMFETHQQMQQNCTQLMGLRQDYYNQQQQVMADVEELINLLDSLIRQFDGYVGTYRIPDINNLSDTEVRRALNEVMFDVWPTLRGLYHLRDLADRLRDSLNRPHAGILLQQSLEKQMSMVMLIRTSMSRTFTRLQIAQKQDEANHLSTLIRAINTGLSGNRGLTETYAQITQVNENLNQLSDRLQIAINQLREVLDGVTVRAAKINSQAQAAMDVATYQASLVLGFLTIFVSSLALLTLLLFGRSLSRRIELLTGYTTSLIELETQPQPVPEKLTQSSDELGMLAQTFDQLMQNLFVAREHLLEESRSQIQLQNQRMMIILENAPYGLCLCDKEERILLANHQLISFYHLPEQLIQHDTSWPDIVRYLRKQGVRIEAATDNNPHIFDPIMAGAQLQSVNLADGRILNITTIKTPDGGSMLIHEDVTERLSQQAKISHMAHHDALTGLPNRVLFRENVIDTLNRAHDNQKMALLYLDLDHFKAVNDTLGHSVGDLLLIEAANRLQRCINDHDLIARLGGDEFAVMLTDNPSREDAQQTASRIIHQLGQLYRLNQQSILVGASIGISVIPEDGNNQDQLFKNADLALYRAKQDGRNTYCFFESEMDALMQARRELELELRSAIEKSQMQLAYQPVINSKTLEIAGFEALLRWHHPQRGWISPSEFIPVAEASGQICDIGAWVLRQACQEASRWPDHLWVAVNVSPVQFKHRDLIQDIHAALQDTPMAASRLELEITEGVLLHNTESTLATLQSIHSLGVNISMDDFGTGYSSLSYLRMFKFDKVKIDQSFISDLHQTQDARAMIGAITSMCENLGIKTTAEGVETREQQDILIQQKCSLLQGYLFGRPVLQAELTKYISTTE